MRELCPHGRPTDVVTVRQAVGGRIACDDCEAEDWTRVGKTTVIGVIIMVALIWVPLCLLLAGVLW